jgi:hypothetical protein
MMASPAVAPRLPLPNSSPMTTEHEIQPTYALELTEALDTALARLDPVAEGLANLRAEAKTLPVIRGLEDRENEAVVRAFHTGVVGTRTRLEKVRVSLKRPALEFGRALDARAKEIEAEIREVEAPVAEALDALARERREIEEARERAEQERLAERVAALARLGVDLAVREIAPWDDEQFEGFLAEATAKHEARLAAEAEAAAAAAAAEAERERERQAKEVEAREMQARLRAQQAEIEEARRSLNAEIERREKAEAAEAERIAAEGRKERERLEALVLERRARLDSLGFSGLVSGAELVDEEVYDRLLSEALVEQEVRLEREAAEREREAAAKAATLERRREVLGPIGNDLVKFAEQIRDLHGARLALLRSLPVIDREVTAALQRCYADLADIIARCDALDVEVPDA